MFFFLLWGVEGGDGVFFGGGLWRGHIFPLNIADVQKKFLLKYKMMTLWNEYGQLKASIGISI